VIKQPTPWCRDGVGTPEYIAPEEWNGEAGLKSDINSLEVVFIFVYVLE